MHPVRIMNVFRCISMIYTSYNMRLMSKIIVIMISLSILVSCSSGDSQQETIAEPTGVHSISELKIDSTVTAPTLAPTVITPTSVSYTHLTLPTKA